MSHLIYIPKINVIPSPVLCVSELYLHGSNMSFKTGFFHSLEFGFFFCEPAVLITRSKVITLRRNTLERMPVSIVLWKCIVDALLPSAKESSTWFLSLVSAWCMDFSLPCSLPFYYFPLILWFSDSHIIYLDVPPKKMVFVECTGGFNFIAKLNSYSFYHFSIIYQNIHPKLILLGFIRCQLVLDWLNNLENLLHCGIWWCLPLEWQVKYTV